MRFVDVVYSHIWTFVELPKLLTETCHASVRPETWADFFLCLLCCVLFARLAAICSVEICKFIRDDRMEKHNRCPSFARSMSMSSDHLHQPHFGWCLTPYSSSPPFATSSYGTLMQLHPESLLDPRFRVACWPSALSTENERWMEVTYTSAIGTISQIG